MSPVPPAQPSEPPGDGPSAPTPVLSGAEVPLEPLLGRTVSVLGYGNQGAAHALNLRDRGIEVVVGARAGGRGAAAARHAGFAPRPLPDAAAAADLVILALPDELQPRLWDDGLAEAVRPGATVGFLHGLAIHRGLVRPAEGTGVVLVAPKGPGATLRYRFERGEGIPCLFAVHAESAAGDARALALAWAAGLGCDRAAVIETTFADETDTDLFGEQVVLCGGLRSLVLAAWQTLVEAGYPADLAYMECCQEVKQVADLVYEHGLDGTMRRISNTAEFGAYVAGDRVIGREARRAMAELLAEIREGDFARGLLDDADAGGPLLDAARTAGAAHPIESAGRAVRAWMPWLGAPDDAAPDRSAGRDSA